MQNEEQSSRQIVKSHIMTIMGVDNLKATEFSIDSSIKK